MTARYWPKPPERWWLRWVTLLPHEHRTFTKEGVGEFLCCRWEVTFTPTIEGARKHYIPGWDAYDAMLKATSAQEAMAILRAAK